MSRADCDELKERLAEVVGEDPSGSGPDRDRLLAHAALCPECGELLRSYRALLLGLKGLDRVRAPADLLDQVWKRIGTEATGGSAGGGADGAVPAERSSAAGRARFRRLYLGIAAGVLLALGLGFYLRESFSGRTASELALAPPAATTTSPLRDDSALGSRQLIESEEVSAGAVPPEGTGAVDVLAPLDLAAAFDAAAKGDRLGDGLKEAGEADRDSARPAPGEGQRRFLVKLPEADRERLDSLITLASSLAAPRSLGTSDLGARQKLITFEVDANRVSELEAGLLGFQGAKRFSEEKLADLKLGSLLSKEVKAETGVAQKPPAKDSPVSESKAFRFRAGSLPAPEAAAMAEKAPELQAQSASAAPPGPGAGTQSREELRAEARQNTPATKTTPSPGRGARSASRPSPEPGAGEPARRYQAPEAAAAETPPATRPPVPPATPAPDRPSLPTEPAGYERAQEEKAKDLKPGVAGKYFQWSAIGEAPKADKLAEMKKLNLEDALAPKGSADLEAPAVPRVRVEIVVEME